MRFKERAGEAKPLPSRGKNPRYKTDPTEEEQKAAHDLFDLAHALLSRGLSTDEAARELGVPPSHVARLRAGPLPPHYARAGRHPLDAILDAERAQALRDKIDAEKRARDAAVEAARERQDARDEAQRVEAQLTKGGRAVVAQTVQASLKLGPTLVKFADAIGASMLAAIANGNVNYEKDLPVLAKAMRANRDLLLSLEAMARITALANEDPALRAATDASILSGGDAREVQDLVNLAMSASQRALALREGAVAIGVTETRKVFAVHRGPVIPDAIEAPEETELDALPGAPETYPTELEDE